MKRLKPITAVFIVLAWLLVLVASPVYAQITWDSYNDAAHNNQDDTFSTGENTVYMFGTGFTATHLYKVSFYEADTDGGGADTADLVETDLVWSNSSGELEAQCTFTDYPNSDWDGWRAVVYDRDDTPPSVYDSGDANIIADDGFTVEQGAIPEFPTVITMLVAIGLSFGIYYWMRQRYRRQAVTA